MILLQLLEVDRSGNKGLVVYLNDQLPNDLLLDDAEWQSLVIYRASLGAKKADDTISSNIEKRKDKVNITKQGNCTLIITASSYKMIKRIKLH